MSYVSDRIHPSRALWFLGRCTVSVLMYVVSANNLRKKIKKEGSRTVIFTEDGEEDGEDDTVRVRLTHAIGAPELPFMSKI